MEKNDEKRKQNEEIWIHTQNFRRFLGFTVVVVTFSVKILHDFHAFGLRAGHAWIFRMLDLISRGAQGHGPVHLLLISAAEVGFAWDSGEQGWVRVSLPPLRMMTGPIQHFRSAILDAWHFHVFFLNFLSVKVLGALNLLILKALRDPAPSVRPYVVGPTGRQPQRSNPVNPTYRTNQRQPQPVVPSASVQSFPPLNQPVPTGRVETSGTGGVPAFPAGNLDWLKLEPRGLFEIQVLF